MDLNFFNPWADATLRTNRLPHWTQPGATYFLTFRLADSLPADLFAQWHEERAAWLERNPEPWSPAQELEYRRRFSTALGHALDQGHGACPLRLEAVRTAVAEVLMKFDRERYWQHAWVIMPNHAHLLFSIREDVVLSDLVRAWKGASSRAAGLFLERRMGDTAFWQKDYFDRLVRDAGHFEKCARYIRRNPEKATLRPGDYTLFLSAEMRAMLE